MTQRLPLLAIPVLFAAAFGIRSRPDPTVYPAFAAGTSAQDGRAGAAAVEPLPPAAEDSDRDRMLVAPASVGCPDAPLPPGIVALLESQNGDGSWGDLPVAFEGRTIGRVGLSSLAVLAFLHHGLSHLSRDVQGGIETGSTVRKALRFLMERQDAAGGIFGAEDRVMEQPLIAFALSEAYGLTGSRLFKEAAVKAIDALQVLQHPDGSWGAPGPTRWASKAFMSAGLSDVPVREEATRSLHGYFIGRPADAAAVTFRMHRREPDVQSAVGTDVARLYEAAVGKDPSTWADLYFTARTLSGYTGQASPRWSAWRTQCDPPGIWAVLGQQALRSTRSSSVLQSALGSLSLAVLYGYRAASGSP